MHNLGIFCILHTLIGVKCNLYHFFLYLAWQNNLLFVSNNELHFVSSIFWLYLMYDNEFQYIIYYINSIFSIKNLIILIIKSYQSFPLLTPSKGLKEIFYVKYFMTYLISLFVIRFAFYFFSNPILNLLNKICHKIFY